MTKVNNAKLTLSKDHTNAAMKNYHATYACFTPFLRNRDNNRDGQMQANEMQWYIPSICETNMLYVAERALPLKTAGLLGTLRRIMLQHYLPQENFHGKYQLDIEQPLMPLSL